jgi:hypothetical protein
MTFPITAQSTTSKRKESEKLVGANSRVTTKKTERDKLESSTRL